MYTVDPSSSVITSTSPSGYYPTTLVFHFPQTLEPLVPRRFGWDLVDVITLELGLIMCLLWEYNNPHRHIGCYLDIRGRRELRHVPLHRLKTSNFISSLTRLKTFLKNLPYTCQPLSGNIEETTKKRRQTLHLHYSPRGRR